MVSFTVDIFYGSYCNFPLLQIFNSLSIAIQVRGRLCVFDFDVNCRFNQQIIAAQTIKQSLTHFVTEIQSKNK